MTTAASHPAPPPAVTESQRSVLYALKRRGEGTAEELATTLAMSVSGARQHLVALATAGLVDHRDEPRPGGGRGRPRRTYHLTGVAESLFPKAYGELTNELLSYVGDEDEALVERIFVRRRHHREEGARRRLEALSTVPAQVEELARILDEDGYLASFEARSDGSFRVAEHNCAILSVARRHPAACSSELDFIRAVLPDATVERVTHMASGDHRCEYVITFGQAGHQ
jgi:DeoR family suf operon transcriptional repressor